MCGQGRIAKDKRGTFPAGVVQSIGSEKQTKAVRWSGCQQTVAVLLGSENRNQTWGSEEKISAYDDRPE